MTEILDEGAVSEIEARLSKFEGFEEAKALCATVKHLRAENELWSMWHVKEPGPCGHHPCQLYDLRKITNNPDAAHGCAACEITALQSQLEQLRAENETLRAADYSALTSDVDDFRSRAIQLCKSKAARYKALADDSLPNDQTAARTAAMATALNAIATEIEKL